MLNNNYFIASKHFLIIFILSIFLVACDKGSEDSKVVEVEKSVPTLNDQNIQDFTTEMAKDYTAKLDSLMVAFNQAKKDDDAIKFVNFRNFKWTPAYIKQKDFYQKVLAKNSSFLAKSTSRPLFDVYENLIYIGIGLKNALLDKDDAKLQMQLAEIQKDKAILNGLID